jgi:hypothetical protein
MQNMHMLPRVTLAAVSYTSQSPLLDSQRKGKSLFQELFYTVEFISLIIGLSFLT